MFLVNNIRDYGLGLPICVIYILPKFFRWPVRHALFVLSRQPAEYVCSHDRWRRHGIMYKLAQKSQTANAITRNNKPADRTGGNGETPV
jgi:hypothetical protein